MIFWSYTNSRNYVKRVTHKWRKVHAIYLLIQSYNLMMRSKTYSYVLVTHFWYNIHHHNSPKGTTSTQVKLYRRKYLIISTLPTFTKQKQSTVVFVNLKYRVSTLINYDLIRTPSQWTMHKTYNLKRLLFYPIDQ